MIFSRISVDGKQEDLSQGSGGMANVRFIGPSYFDTFRIPVLKGRTFEPREPEAIILSEKIARKLFNGSIDVIGHSIRPGTGESWRTVVGVVGDVHNKGIESGDPEYYLPLSREPDASALALTVRTQGEADLVATLLRAEIHAIDPHLPLKFETMEQITGKLTATPRFSAAVLLFFTLSGLLIGATGVYAVVSFLISQRSKEIAVRIAVGATAGQIRGMVLGTSMRWAGAGIVGSGMLLAGILPLIRNLLYETPPTRPLLIVAVLAMLGLVVLGASVIPARRAARTDPMGVLRQD
jgi:putative ABC transport system permease protein